MESIIIKASDVVNDVVENFFGQPQANSYDARWSKLAPIQDNLHFLAGIILKDLPSDARILCVGAGTGVEILGLAKKFPSWKFTALDPSSSMLEVCRKNIVGTGLEKRCEFHLGYVHSLPKKALYDAATSILVSQFLTQVDQRRAFFQEIQQRLKSGAYLLNADLAAASSPDEFKSLEHEWFKAQEFSGLPQEQAQMSTASWKEHVAVLPPNAVAEIIASAGFVTPTLFYQNLFIHAWFAKVP